MLPVAADNNTLCCLGRCEQCSWARGGLSGDKILSKMAEHGARHSAGFRLDPFSQSHACSTYSAAATASKHMSSTPWLTPSPHFCKTDILCSTSFNRFSNLFLCHSVGKLRQQDTNFDKSPFVCGTWWQDKCNET